MGEEAKMYKLGPDPQMPDHLAEKEENHTDNYEEMSHVRTQGSRVQIRTDSTWLGKIPESIRGRYRLNYEGLG